MRSRVVKTEFEFEPPPDQRSRAEHEFGVPLFALGVEQVATRISEYGQAEMEAEQRARRELAAASAVSVSRNPNKPQF
jgi:hypothetical protein